MKNGMKQTEIGEIPVEWEVRKLEDISNFITKGSTPTTYGYDWVQEGVVFLRSECVSMQGFSLSGAMHISKEAHCTMNRSIIKAGDILMTITGNVGRVCILPETIEEANINQHIARIRIADSEVESQFVYQFLAQEGVIREYSKITTGQAYPQLSLKQVRETYVPFPPLPEQRKIAEILSTLDEKMAVMDEQLAQTQELKKGLMQRLLTKGIGHTQFKGSPLGEIPASWEVVKMKEVCSKVTDGTHFSPKATTSGAPFITAVHVKEGFIDFASCKYLPQDVHEEIYRRCNPEKGDVLMVNIGAGTATPALVKVDFEFSLKNVALLKPDKKKLRGDFLELYQIFKKKSIVETLLTGGAQPFLSLKALSDLALSLPPLPEQCQIADILTTVDEKIGVLQDKKAQVQALKRGLMQQLLTGQRRVRVAEPVTA